MENYGTHVQKAFEEQSLKTPLEWHKSIYGKNYPYLQELPENLKNYIKSLKKILMQLRTIKKKKFDVFLTLVSPKAFGTLNLNIGINFMQNGFEISACFRKDVKNHITLEKKSPFKYIGFINECMDKQKKQLLKLLTRHHIYDIIEFITILSINTLNKETKKEVTLIIKNTPLYKDIINIINLYTPELTICTWNELYQLFNKYISNHAALLTLLFVGDTVRIQWIVKQYWKLQIFKNEKETNYNHQFNTVRMDYGYEKKTHLSTVINYIFS
jgi:hypothetical protein